MWPFEQTRLPAHFSKSNETNVLGHRGNSANDYNLDVAPSFDFQTLMSTKLSSLACWGWTNAGAAYWNGYRALKALGDQNALNVILFFTDGQPNTIAFGQFAGVIGVPLWSMARRRFFVESVERGHARITGQEAHHLTRVLRVEAGQQFEISDNRDVYLAEVETARRELVSFAILKRVETAAARLHTWLFASLTKFDRFEGMLEKATELGVERVTPVQTERSEKGLEQAARKRLPRWQRIAREASEQSRRAWLPSIELPIDLVEALRNEAAYRYVLDEAGTAPILSALPDVRQTGDRVAVLVGPEGGWTDRERVAILDAGWTAVSLGQGILRAETAAIAAMAILNAAWGNAGQ